MATKEVSLSEAAALVRRSPRQIQRLLAEGKVQYRKAWVPAEGQHLLKIDVDSLQAYYAVKPSKASQHDKLLAEIRQIVHEEIIKALS